MVTLALAYDVDAIAKAGLIAKNWQTRLPNNSAPTPRPSSSWCARGTPRRSRTGTTWSSPGVSVITPNPKTSGGARWNYLAAWGYALRKFGNDPAKAKDFVKPDLQERAGPRHRRPRLDRHLRRARHRRRADRLGERGPARRQGTWGQGRVPDRGALREHPGRAAGGGGGQGGRQAQDRGRSRTPTSSSSTRPRGRRSRPSTTTGRATRTWPRSTRQQFPKVQLFTIDEVFGGWAKAQKTHFADGGIFDQIYGAGR